MPAALRPRFVPVRPLTGLAALLGLRRPGDGPEQASFHNDLRGVTGITHDSTAVQAGDLYAALPGSKHHGAAFCDQAASAGAVAVLTDPDGRSRAAASGLPVLVVADPRARLGEVSSWIYGDPSHRLALVGVTGTSGKTSTTYLIESGLRMAGHLTGLIGGVETRVGRVVAPSLLTTPEATDLQALLAVMAERQVTAAAMEVSSHALALGRVAGTSYEIAVFTNLSQDHLDFHSDMDSYFAVKAELFTPRYAKAGVVNMDDPRGRRLAAAAPIPITTFSAAGRTDADWRAVDVRRGADGSSFQVIGPGGVEADASVTMPGPFNVSNALAAIVALVELGVGLGTAVAGVAACPGVPGRLERVEAGPDLTVLVDYSHKPGAVQAVLSALRPVTQGSLRIVLGCGGDRDAAKRPLMGAAAAELADVAIFTSDNPRSEDPLAILHEMLAGTLSVPPRDRAHVIIEPDRAAAIAMAVSAAAKGDVVLIAGKGHERGQYVAGQVIPFDDREVAAAALAARARADQATVALAKWALAVDGLTDGLEGA
ncbi:MAG TPA: UDP-N-acetylmuramoyl-L-alanyl-D-glutamate--2,6-diaminopimelate ligase [Streptosporangiaceae bacterium]|nr:UDP-N-acetylmuramoyl-L-alanyl-D-glutamate--2,6-diaminopimelate ligase [Streptosporangiaceae bacterium]